MQEIKYQKPTIGSYLVGAYLFSVPSFSYSSELGLNFVPQILGVIVLLYAVIDVVRYRKVNISVPIILYGLFIYWLIFTYGLSCFFEHNPRGVAALSTPMKVGLITIGVAQLIKNDSDFYNSLSIYGFSIFFVVFLNYETILYLRSASEITGMDRFDGTLTNANTAAIYAISVIWCNFILICHPNRLFIVKVLSLMGSCLAFFILFYSGSKKGMIGIFLFVIFTVWLFFRRSKSWKKLLVITVGFLFLIIVLYFIKISPFYYRLELMVDGGNKGSTAYRIILFKTAIEIWAESFTNFIFGIGHGNFASHSQNIFKGYSHSTISEVLVSTGVIGFLLYFGALCTLLRNLYGRVGILLKKSSSHFLTACSCFIFVIIVLFFNSAAVMYTSREIWPILGVISSYSRYLGKKKFASNNYNKN